MMVLDWQVMNTQVMHNLLNTYALPAIIVFFSKLARKDCDSVVYNVNQIMSDKSNRTVYAQRGIADVLKHSTELRPKETSYKTRESNYK